MRTLAFRHLDVFATRGFEGNPLAVFTDEDDLDDDTMQAIAREMNLSETVFLSPPRGFGNCASLRIFTPRRELRFAGHPTIGAAHVLLGLGRAAGERFIVEEAVGDIPIRVENDSARGRILWLETPTVTFGATADPERCAAALGISVHELLPGVEPQYVTAGSAFLYIPLASPEIVDRVCYDPKQLPVAPWPDVVGTFVFAMNPCTVDGLPAVYSRMFAPESGIPEDPATGGGTGPLARYICRNGLLSARQARRFVSEQGVKMGRRSLIYVATNGEGSLEVGGTAFEIGRGQLMV